MPSTTTTKLPASHVGGLLLGIVIGLRFPDIDQRLPFLVHRCILTHSVFVLALLACWKFTGRKGAEQASRLIAVGAGLGLAVHFAFDLFPRAWWRHALIHIPFYGWTSPLFSQVWLAASVLLSLLVTTRFLRSKAEEGWGLLALTGAYFVAARAEPRIAVPAFLTLFTAICITAQWFRSPRR